MKCRWKLQIAKVANYAFERKWKWNSMRNKWDQGPLTETNTKCNTKSNTKLDIYVQYKSIHSSSSTFIFASIILPSPRPAKPPTCRRAHDSKLRRLIAKTVLCLPGRQLLMFWTTLTSLFANYEIFNPKRVLGRTSGFGHGLYDGDVFTIRLRYGRCTRYSPAY